MPTDNLECEQDVFKFGILAKSLAATSNRKFTAQSIEDDMILNKAGNVLAETVTKSIARVLDEQEKKWVEKLQILTQE